MSWLEVQGTSFIAPKFLYHTALLGKWFPNSLVEVIKGNMPVSRWKKKAERPCTMETYIVMNSDLAALCSLLTQHSEILNAGHMPIFIHHHSNLSLWNILSLPLV